MTCYHPLHAFKTGLLTDSGKDLLFVTDKPGGHVPVYQVNKSLHVNVPLNPEFVNLDNEPYLFNCFPVPCGKCTGCLLDKSRSWAVRCVLESTYYVSNYFVTFTYDDLHYGSPLLDLRDMQLFFKRLRNYKTFRYFGCGEYGSISGRKHWHICFFGLALDDLQVIPNRQGDYRSQLLESCWKKGMIQVNEFNFKTASYVARYCMKKCDSKYNIQLMSRNPGIGRRWLDDHFEDLRDDPNLYVSDGRMPLPSYFKKYCNEKFGDDWKIGLQLVAKENSERADKVFRKLHSCNKNDDVGWMQDKLVKYKIKNLKRNKL